MIVDLTNPRKPQSVELPAGGARLAQHDRPPERRLPVQLQLGPGHEHAPGDRHLRHLPAPRRRSKVQDYPIPYMPTSLGSESHDITFNADGNRAYSAALSQTLVLDTTEPGASPSRSNRSSTRRSTSSHQADPVTLTREDGSKRKVLVVTDERAGAAASLECPGGGLHLYDITGAMEQAPRRWAPGSSPPTSRRTAPPAPRTCCGSTREQEMLTIAWYAQGVRVLDISGLADVEGSPAASASVTASACARSATT